MSRRHPNSNRLTPPRGFVELHHRAEATRPVASGPSPAPVVALCTTLKPVDERESVGATKAAHPVVGGLGVVRVSVDSYARGTLAVPRRRNVFQTSTAARIRAYYEALPEASKTRRLVPPSVGQRPSRFNTRLLREALKFALCAGGPGLSRSDQMWYISVLLLAKRGGGAQGRGAGRHGRLGGRKLRLPEADDGSAEEVPSGRGEDHVAEVVPEVDSLDDMQGELGRAFPSKSAFAAAVREEQRRVLSKLRWDETPIEVEGVMYLVYSRDLLLVALDLLQNAGHVQLWGEELGLGSDGSRLRSDMLDSDLFLTEELHVRRVHGSLSFVLAVQLFIDEAVVSWSGAHYVYAIRALVPNVRDRRVQ